MKKFLEISNCRQCLHSSSNEHPDEHGNCCWKLGRKIPINVSIPDDCPLPDAPTQQVKVEQRADNTASLILPSWFDLTKDVKFASTEALYAAKEIYSRIAACQHQA